MVYVVHSLKLRCRKSSKNALEVVPGEYARGWVIQVPDENDVTVEIWLVWSSWKPVNIQQAGAV